MELINGDCLEVMRDMSDNSIDFLFCDLPYAQTSCKWDVLIDLEQFWKQVNRICKQEATMAFTCSVKFGNSLINSNPKCFRYDLIWVKSAACGFLNSKKMPMKKHEMVYIFYRKLPKVYTENILLHHTHKFLKQDKILYKKSEYKPPLPNSIIKEENIIVETRDVEGLYGKEKDKIRFKVNGKLRDSEPRYNPPLPNSVIKEENIVYDQQHKSDLYGEKTKRDNIHKTRYDPPLPNSVIKEEYTDCYDRDRKHLREGYLNKKYDPPLPNTILEIKSEKGKHATQKPVPLMEWLIKYYTREGEVVLDPTMGSGGTGIACKNLNRAFIGIEKDEEIYKIALERNK